MGVTEGFAWIDVDGIGGLPAVYVNCKYGSEEIKITHSYPYKAINYYRWTRHWLYNAPLSWVNEVSYYPNTVDSLHTFLDTVATTAEQTVIFV